MLKLDIKNIEKLYTDFIKKNLSDVDLTMEYVKILNNKLMKNTDFKAKFDFLNLIYVPRIGEVYLNLRRRLQGKSRQVQLKYQDEDELHNRK